MVTRDAGITSPLLIDFADGSVGSSMLMYFWPNSVVGRISIVAFWGMSLADDGFSATLMTASCPSLPTFRTWPDEHAVAAYVAELVELETGVLRP